MNLELLSQYSLPMIFIGGSCVLYLSSRLLRPLIGIGYPLLKTCKILNTTTHANGAELAECRRNLQNINKYWVCFGAFTLSEVVADQFFPYFLPFYNQGKLLAVIALQCNWGDAPLCVVIFDKYISPVCNEIYPLADSLLEKSSDVISSEIVRRSRDSRGRIEALKDELKHKLTNFIFVKSEEDKDKSE